MQHSQLPSSSPSSRTSPLPLPVQPPPLPPKHERRLSIKSIAASLRRSTSFSSTVDGESPFSHWSSQDENRFTKSRRSSSLFSWKSNRSSVVVVERSDEIEEKLKTYKFPSKANTSSRSNSRSRRARNTSPPPPVPPLVIEIDSLPTLSSNHYKPLPSTLSRVSPSSERASLPPSLPDFRHSTFQPLTLDALTSTMPPSLPRLPTTVAKQLAARGPFPNRPLSTASSKSTDHTSKPRSRTTPASSQRSPTPLPLPPAAPGSGTSKLSSAPRLEPRSPRVHRRTRSTPIISPPSTSLLRTPPPVSSLPPPPAPSTGSSASSSMVRSPSFTLSLPTVAEVPPSPTPPPKRKLRPILIAPRTPSTPSTPDLSHFSTANSSPSFSSFELKDKDGVKSSVLESGGLEQKEKIDWEDLEKRLRNLSEDRLQILLAELERTK
ncbi:hypothetical protein JCM3765_002346 [Sporobolomyces pararoseus]